MKKLAILLALILTASGCASTNVDELISVRELPEYGEILDIEVNETEGDEGVNEENVITIE